ncbi:MAG TPA: hypothetical protein VF470_06100, partial [Sphingomicrobium sp.]
EVLIAMLDIADGDPDAEADDRGGESIAIVEHPDLPPEDGESDPDLEETGAEDSFMTHGGSGPGCSVADPGGAGEGEDDEPDGCGEGDPSYAEWHTLAASQRRAGLVNGKPADDWCRTVLEDDEDDDRDTCSAAEDQGTRGGRWFETDGYPGEAADTELNGDEGDHSR